MRAIDGIATPECGVAWVPSGPAPQTVLFVPNMAIGPGFAHGIDRARAGHEREALGPCHPDDVYCETTRDFEALGCPVPR